MTHYLCIACETLARPIYSAAARSINVIDIELIKRGLHNDPASLRKVLQEQIILAEGKTFEAILLGYGLCGNGVAGLTSHSKPLVIPRVHDCISLLLGDPQRYLDQFINIPGTYWYTQDFVERNEENGKFATLGPISDRSLSEQYEVFVKRYGKDNAEYLIDTLYAWQSHYQRAVFIDTQITNVDEFEKKIKMVAEQYGWLFEKLIGNLSMFNQLFDGFWQSSEVSNFLVVPPFHSIVPTYDENIFRCMPI